MIDRKTGIYYCGGDAELYKEVLSDWCEETKQELDRLQAYLAAGDLKNYAVLAHAIKGTALTIGASEFAARAKRHQLAADAGDIAFIQKDFDSFSKEGAALIAEAEEG